MNNKNYDLYYIVIKNGNKEEIVFYDEPEIDYNICDIGCCT